MLCANKTLFQQRAEGSVPGPLRSAERWATGRMASEVKRRRLLRRLNRVANAPAAPQPHARPREVKTHIQAKRAQRRPCAGPAAGSRVDGPRRHQPVNDETGCARPCACVQAAPECRERPEDPGPRVHGAEGVCPRAQSLPERAPPPCGTRRMWINRRSSLGRGRRAGASRAGRPREAGPGSAVGAPSAAR